MIKPSDLADLRCIHASVARTGLRLLLVSERGWSPDDLDVSP